MKPVLEIVEGIRSLGYQEAHRLEIRRLCGDIAASLRARKFVEGGNGEFNVTITDGQKKNTAIATVTDSGQTIYVSLIKLRGEKAVNGARTYTFNWDRTRIHIHSAQPVTFGELRWCLKEFLRGSLSSLNGKYGRTFSQMLDEEFYLKLQSECSAIKHNTKEDILKYAVQLFLTDKEMFSLSPRLGRLLETDINADDHLIQATLCASSGHERRSRAEREKSTAIAIEKLKLVSSGVFRQLIHQHRITCKGGPKNGLCFNIRKLRAFLTVKAVRSESAGIDLRPSLMLNLPFCTLRITWYTPSTFSIEKLTVGDWRHVLLTADTETRLDAKSMNKLTRRLERISSYLNGSAPSAMPPISVDSRKIA